MGFKNFFTPGEGEIGWGMQRLRAPCLTDRLRFEFLLRPALLLGSPHSDFCLIFLFDFHIRFTFSRDTFLAGMLCLSGYCVAI